MRVAASLFASAWVALLPQQATRSEHVILVIAEGLRHQELFGGADGSLLGEGPEVTGIEDLQAIRAEFWSEQLAARRGKLMPFFWTELGPRGLVLGHRALDNRVSVRNPYRLFHPGLAEVLNGEPPGPGDEEPEGSRRFGLLEHVRNKLGLDTSGVAAFGSREGVCRIAVGLEGAAFCEDGIGPDEATSGLAVDYARRVEPRFLLVVLSDVDARAEERRYDRTLRAIQEFDESLRRLWTLVRSSEVYRDRTTLLVTTAHGRGRGSEWASHGPEVAGSEETWIALLGPDTPARGVARGGRSHFESNVAATILELFELNYQEFNPQADPPIQGAIREP